MGCIHTNIIVKPAACRKLYCETFKKESKMNEKALLALEKANRIRLLDTERESVAAFFARADADFEELSRVDTKGVLPMVHVMPVEAPLRADEVRADFSREELQKNAPQLCGTQWAVPRVIE